MKRLQKLTAIGVLLAASLTCFAEDKPELSFSTTEVAPGIYMLMGVGGFTGGNLGLSVGEDGVVMIDDSMPPMLGIMETAIKSITDKPVDFLINTHVHGDHTGNNETMGKNGARIVAHENLRNHLVTKGVRGKDGMKPAPEKALPVITFSHAINFHLNGNDAHIFHTPNAHTDGDSVIHFKNANVIHAGDTLFNGIFPYIDLDSGGSVDGFIAAQKRMLRISDNKTKIIPGHGPLANKKDLEASIAMLEDSAKLVGKLVASGKSEDEVVKLNPLAKYHDKWNWNFITTEKMTRQIFNGLKQESKHSHHRNEGSQKDAGNQKDEGSQGHSH